jgi:RNA polymerase sigma-70 factor (ECF subfamily)
MVVLAFSAEGQESAVEHILLHRTMGTEHKSNDYSSAKMSASDVRLTELKDEDLVRSCVDDPAALEELIRRYEVRVRHCAERMSLRRDEAEDLVQETFLRVFLALPRYQRKSSFATWLYSIAHKTCIDAARRQLRRPRVWSVEALAASGRAPSSGLSIDAQLEAQIRECYIGRAISSLPPDYQAIVQLRLVDGLSNEATAEQLGISLESVKGKLQRARKILRKRLSEPEECPLCQGLGTFRIVPKTLETPGEEADVSRFGKFTLR